MAANGEGPEDLRDVVIVGAGPAGLAVGACLARAGLSPVLLERGEAPGWSWARHYEALRLHTPRRFSSLPFLPLPPGEAFPSRAELADYLAAYARRFRLDVRTATVATGIAPSGDGLIDVSSSRGRLRARACVVATGANRLPRIPAIPGRELFRGPVLHSGEVRSGAELAGRRVLVVGLGNSGGDLAADLARHGARVSVAVGAPGGPALPLRVAGVSWRTATLFVPGALCAVARRLGLGRLAWGAAAALWAAVQERHAGDLRPLGLPLLPQEALREPALWSRPPLTSSAVLDAVRRGEVELVARLDALRDGEAVLSGGRVVEVDAVLLATGFRHGLEELLPGRIRADGPLSDGPLEGVPGLFLCGFAPELRLISRSARRTARAVASFLAARGS